MAKKNKRPSERGTAAIAPVPVEFNPDYSNTKKDLARIGALAGFFVVALVVLSFFVK